MTALRDQLTIRPPRRVTSPAWPRSTTLGIAERVATFETSPRTIEDIRSWVDDGQPFIVAIDDER